MYKISIIVPVYNVEKYLCKCIESILGQTFTDFELILVNDGSTDRSGEICDKYKYVDKRIKVIHKENGGLSSARNAGIDIAEGEYIGFIDSDDWIDLNMYNKLYNLAILNGADITQCNFQKVYDEATINEDSIEQNIRIINKNEALKDLLECRELYIQSVVTWNKVYKKYLFENIRFPEGKIHEDEFTTYKVFDKANKLVRTNEKLYFYRQTPNSIMNSKFNKKRLDYFEALRQQLNYFKNYNNEFYEMVLANYDMALRNTYFKAKNYMNDSEILNSIIKIQKELSVLIIKSNNISYGKKIICCAFRINPNLYKIIQKIRKKKIY